MYKLTILYSPLFNSSFLWLHNHPVKDHLLTLMWKTQILIIIIIIPYIPEMTLISVLRKGGWIHTSIQDSVHASIQRLEDYIKKRWGKLITATRNNTNNKSINSRKHAGYNWPDIKNGKKNNFMDILSEKQARSHTRRLRKGNLLRETESFLIAAQNNAIRTNNVKVRIDKTQQIAGVDYVVIETKRLIT